MTCGHKPRRDGGGSGSSSAAGAPAVAASASASMTDASRRREATAPAPQGDDELVVLLIECDLRPQQVAALAGVQTCHVVLTDEDGASGAPRYHVVLRRRYLRDVWVVLAVDGEVFVEA